MAFVDSHAHLDGLSKDELALVLGRARAAGLSHVVAIGASDGLGSNAPTVAIAEDVAEVYATVGVHPHDAHLVDAACLAEIERLAAHPKVVGIGETGLDYHYDRAPREAQRAAFSAFMDLARRRRLPIVVHTREAEADTMALLAEAKAGELGGVLHCFTGTAALADFAIELGLHVSFSGVLTFRNADELRAIARRLPKDRVLVETDCPYLTPVPHRGKKNEPAYVAHTVEVLAGLWSIPPAEARAITGENALRLFRIPAA